MVVGPHLHDNACAVVDAIYIISEAWQPSEMCRALGHNKHRLPDSVRSDAINFAKG